MLSLAFRGAALKRGVVRAGVAKDSDKVGELAEGESFVAIGGQLLEGQLRVQFDRGWVSESAASGKQLLELVSGAHVRPESDDEEDDEDSSEPEDSDVEM